MVKTPKIVLDTNIIISGLGWDGKPEEIIILIEKGLIINSEGIVRMPENIINILPKDKPLKAIIMMSDIDEQEDKEWSKLTANEFFMCYSEKDSIYDNI